MNQDLSRRAALAALATAGALSSVPVASAMLDTGAPTETQEDDFGEGYKAGLELFAYSWLRRWTDKGGNAYFGKICKRSEWETTEARLITGFPTYHYSPVYKDAQAVLDAAIANHGMNPEHREIAQSGDSDRYDGAMRELYAIMEAVPGGFKAVERLVRKTPSLGLARSEGKPAEASDGQ